MKYRSDISGRNYVQNVKMHILIKPIRTLKILTNTRMIFNRILQRRTYFVYNYIMLLRSGKIFFLTNIINLCALNCNVPTLGRIEVVLAHFFVQFVSIKPQTIIILPIQFNELTLTNLFSYKIKYEHDFFFFFWGGGLSSINR